MNNDTLTSEEPSVCDKDEAQEEQEVKIKFSFEKTSDIGFIIKMCVM